MTDLSRTTPQASSAYERLIQSWGGPLSVTSGYRSPEYNQRVGGAKQSQHMHGNAYDVSTKGMTRDQQLELIRMAQASGFGGVGVYDGSLHFDVGPQRAWGSDYTRKSLPDWAASALGVSSGGGADMVNGGDGGDRLMDGYGNNAQPRGLLEMLGIQKRDEAAGGETALPFYQRGSFKDTMGNLAVGLNSLRLNPDPNLAARVGAGQERRQEAAKANRTVEWLLRQPDGEKYAELAAAAGPAVALKKYQDDTSAAANPNVQSVMQLPDGGSVYYMRDGTTIVRNVSGEVLQGQAAVDYVKQSQEYGVGLERDKFAGREEGKLTTQADLGAAASAANESGKLSIKVSGEYFEKANAVNSSLSNLQRAIDAIDAGAQSGAVANMLPDVTQASGELRSAINSLGLDVVSGTTFGALSEGELNLAMATAVPQNLPPEELRSWLVARLAAQQKAASELYRAAAFFNNGGSIAKWIEENPNNKAAGSSTIVSGSDQSEWSEGPNGTKIRKVK